MYTNIFTRICKIYTNVFPEKSFQFYFDGKKQPLIGNNKSIVTAKFHNTEDVFKRIFKEGSIGLGESYCEGNIEVKDSEYKDFLLIFARIAYNSKKILYKFSWLDIFRIWKAQFVGRRLFTKGSQNADINSHYSLSDWFEDEDDSNKFYLEWLNAKYIQYSSGKWDEGTKTLEKAQLNKLGFYAKRLGIDKKSKGKTLLDLGCGWGGMMFYMAENFGLKCKGYTLSVAQAAYIRGQIQKRKLENLVNVEIRNIHDIKGTYNYIISVGVMEHIKDFTDLYKKISKALKKEGRALIHSMFQNFGGNGKPDPFLRKYIFPGGAVPCIKSNLKIFKKYFKYVDRNDLPNKSYPKTLACWYDKFCQSEKNIRKLLKEKGKVKNIDFATRIFKHYLASIYCGLYEDEIVGNILVHN